MPKQLDPNFAVMGQPPSEAFEQLAEEGFRRVICNRVEGEDPNQPRTSDMAAAAEAAGLSFVHVPVAMSALGQATVADMEAAIEGADGPVLAYCGSGQRSTLMWSLIGCMRGRLTVEEALAKAAEAGYDLSGARPLLQSVRAARRDG